MAKTRPRKQLRKVQRAASKALKKERMRQKKKELASIPESCRWFNSKLAMHKLKVNPVKDDGNSFFRAIADQIQGDQNEHMYIRKLIV